MTLEFHALVKEFQAKALVTGDKSYRVLLETTDVRVQPLVAAPANVWVKVTIEPLSGPSISGQLSPEDPHDPEHGRGLSDGPD